MGIVTGVGTYFSIFPVYIYTLFCSWINLLKLQLTVLIIRESHCLQILNNLNYLILLTQCMLPCTPIFSIDIGLIYNKILAWFDFFITYVLAYQYDMIKLHNYLIHFLIENYTNQGCIYQQFSTYWFWLESWLFSPCWILRKYFVFLWKSTTQRLFLLTWTCWIMAIYIVPVEFEKIFCFSVLMANGPIQPKLYSEKSSIWEKGEITWSPQI